MHTVVNRRAWIDLSFNTEKETFIFYAYPNDENQTLSIEELNKLKNGQAQLIVFDDYEPTNFYHFSQKFPNLLDDIPHKNIVIISSNKFYELNPQTMKKDRCPYKVFYFNEYFDFMINRHVPADGSFDVIKHFTCLSRVDKYFRRYFYYLLKTNDLLPFGFVSHNRVTNSTEDKDIYFENMIKNTILNYDQYLEISNSKLVLDDTSESVIFNNTTNFSKNSGIEVVLETSIKGCNFVSEKTIKAILNKNIFLLVGGYQTLNFLKKLGFKTFDHIVDESYDNIKCDFLRTTRVFESLKSFCFLSLDEVEKIKNDNQELLEYNYNHLLYNLDSTFNLKSKVESYFKGETNGRN